MSDPRNPKTWARRCPLFPSEWQVVRQLPRWGSAVVVVADHLTEKDAREFAAAGDLLNAGRDLLRAIEEAHIIPGGGRPANESLAAAVEKATRRIQGSAKP